MIQKDSRHHSVEPKVVGYTDKRVFSKWSMGSWLIENDSPKEVTMLKDLKKYMSDPINDVLQSTKYISMMHNILESWVSQDTAHSQELKDL
jgi:hypothetical protein